MKKHIPNTITCLNLLSGLVAIILAFNPTMGWGPLSAQSWAFIFIAAAALFDFCDGFAARLLKAYSPMGKELDSLCDLVSFGLAPAFLVMNAMLASGASLWASMGSLFIAVMGALRLAKFNVDTRQTTSFVGLPIPANALFWIGFLGWMRVHGYPGTAATLIIVAIVSLLMVSELKMFSLKFANLSLRENLRRYVILLAAVVFLLTDGLAGLAWTIVLYVLISLLGKRTEA